MRRTFGAAVFVFIAMAVLAVMPLYSQVERSQKSLIDAIASLGSDDEKTAKGAQQRLLSLGKAALPALEDAAKSANEKDREIIESVIADIKMGITADMRQELVDRLHQFANSVGKERLNLADNFGNFGADLVDNVLLLKDEEENPEVEEKLDEYLCFYAASTVRGMIRRGEVARAEQFMSEGHKQIWGGEADRAWGAYCLLTDRYQPECRKLETALRAESTEDTRTIFGNKLAYLHRAAGNLKAAREAAHDAGDPWLSFALLVESGDWSALAGPDADLEFKGGRPQARYAAQALAALYAGDQKQYEKCMAELPHQLGREKYWDDRYPQVLLALHQPDEAVREYSERGKWSAAVAILRNRRRYADALGLIEEAMGENPPDLRRLKLESAEILIELGEKAKGVKALDDLTLELNDELRSTAKELEAESPEQRNKREPEWEYVDTFGRVAALWRRVSEDKKCWDLAAHFIEVFPPETNRVYALLDRLYDGDFPKEWYLSMFRRLWPDTPTPDLLKKLEEFITGKIKRDEMEAILNHMYVFIKDMNETADDERSWCKPVSMSKAIVLETLERAGIEGDLSRALWNELYKQHPRALREVIYKRARAAARKKDWDAVGMAYQQLADQGEGDWPRYLAGYALVQSGKKVEGESLMNNAQTLMLASNRTSLSYEAYAMGFGELGIAQDQLALRFSQPLDSEWFTAARSLGFNTGLNHEVAAKMLEKYLVACLSSASEPPHQPLQVATKQHVLAAMAAAEKKQWERVQKEMDWAMKLYPIMDDDELLEVIGVIDAAGGRQMGDLLVKRQLANMEEQLDKFPRAADLHNSTAWLLARSGRNLDSALDHANKAMQYMPGSAAIMDTLAEVHFARGEIKEAVAIETKAVELAPDWQMLKEQLGRFEKAPGKK